MHHATAVLEIHAARRRFGERQVLAGINLEARAGEILVLLGPNGAGKSTLMRAICGRTRLDDGSVCVDGSPAGSRAARTRIGVVPQHIALYGQLSVRANLEIFGRLSGLRGDALEAAVTRALAWTSLAERGSDPVAHLSGGMQRRVNIAAGALHEPRLLLLDEPTVGVDPAARRGIHAALRELRDRGMGLVLSTHDLHEAEELADRVALLSEGRLCAIGAVKDLVGQAFGTGRELAIVLESAPGPAATAILEAAGLGAAGNLCQWLGVLHGDEAHSGVDALLRRLEAAGAAVGEVHVRKPGLHGVFLRLTGREPGDAP